MEHKSGLVVLVTDNSSEAERLGGILGAARYRVLPIADPQTAEARISGGGVDLLVLQLSAGPQADRLWDGIASIHRHNAELPILGVGEPGAKDLGPLAGSIPAGLPIVQEADLVTTAQALIERRRNLSRKARRDGSAAIIAIQGAKGGVGASTVALNLAAVLAGQGKTILTEMRSVPGTLAFQFGVRRKVRSVADLASGAAAIVPADVEDCLWPCQQIPGLSVLFGPQSYEGRPDWSERAGQILRAAAEAADYVVVDLPHCYSGLHRAALRETDCFLLVLERDALCLQSGKLMLGAIESENLMPQSAAAVVVNRIPLSLPLDLAEVERELSVSVLASMPPAADLCLRAYRERKAVVILDPESMLAGSYARLAESLPAALRLRRPVHA